MTDATTDTTEAPPRWSFRSYHETPEHAALRGALQPPPEPISIARTHLSRAVADDGYVIDLSSIEEEEREAVIVNAKGDDYAIAGPQETPSGHIITWTCTGYPRVGTDAGDPVLSPAALLFEMPENLREADGAVRLRHNLGGPVTAYAFKADGTPITYLLATPLDNHLLHVEYLAGTAEFRVSLDD